MLIFFSDESLIKGDGAAAYGIALYGGLILDKCQFKEMSDLVFKLKKKYLYPQELDLKWRFASVWENLKKVHFTGDLATATKSSHPEAYESFKSDYERFKEDLLNEVSGHDVKFVIAIRPNKLLNASDEQNIKYSIEAVARKFEKILEKENELGVILADELRRRVSSEEKIDYQYILDLCNKGSKDTIFKRLISIVPTINSGVSPVHQLNDILLGVVQYYIFQYIRKLKDQIVNNDEAKRLFAKLVKIFYKTNGKYTINSGVILYPPRNTRRDTPAGVFLDKLEKQLETDFGLI